MTTTASSGSKTKPTSSSKQTASRSRRRTCSSCLYNTSSDHLKSHGISEDSVKGLAGKCAGDMSRSGKILTNLRIPATGPNRNLAEQYRRTHLQATTWRTDDMVPDYDDETESETRTIMSRSTCRSMQQWRIRRFWKVLSLVLFKNSTQHMLVTCNSLSFTSDSGATCAVH